MTIEEVREILKRIIGEEEAEHFIDFLTARDIPFKKLADIDFLKGMGFNDDIIQKIATAFSELKEEPMEEEIPDEEEMGEEFEEEEKEIEEEEKEITEKPKQVDEQMIQQIVSKELKKHLNKITKAEKKKEEVKEEPTDYLKTQLEKLKKAFENVNYVRVIVYYIDPVTHQECLVKGPPMQVPLSVIGDKAQFIALIQKYLRWTGDYKIEVAPPKDKLGETISFILSFKGVEKPSDDEEEVSYGTPKKLLERIERLENLLTSKKESDVTTQLVTALLNIMQQQQKKEDEIEKFGRLLNIARAFTTTSNPMENVQQSLAILKQLLGALRDLGYTAQPEEYEEEEEVPEEEKEDTSLKKWEILSGIIEKIFAPRQAIAQQPQTFGQPTQIPDLSSLKPYVADLIRLVKEKGPQQLAQEMLSDVSEGLKSFIDLLKTQGPANVLNILSTIEPKVAEVKDDLRILFELLSK